MLVPFQRQMTPTARSGAPTLDSKAALAFVQRVWDGRIVPKLVEYVRIPAKSPMFDAHWAERDRNVDTTAIAYANVINAWRRLIPESVVEEAEAHVFV